MHYHVSYAQKGREKLLQAKIDIFPNLTFSCYHGESQCEAITVGIELAELSYHQHPQT